ncbi:MAG: hypothetical protein HYV09_02580 [Deltaproteobacteria bacterium]|nr:hypothetical protein [Deltaproteobacteria bacterium]
MQAIAKRDGGDEVQPVAPYDCAELHVMSGTGNSLRAARWAEAGLSEAGVPTHVRLIDGAAPIVEPDGGKRALVGIFMPTHGFTAPWLAIKFVARMPRRAGADALCVATRASMKLGPFATPGMSGTATLVVATILALKGYRIRGLLGLDMPSNWLQVHPGFAPQSVSFVLDKARPRVEWLVSRVLGGRVAIPFWGFLYDVVSGVPLLPISFLYLIYGRLFFGKMFFASDRCDGCGLCEIGCPVSGVKVIGKSRPRPYWNYHCESCNRCVAFCPRKAIEIGHGWATFLTVLGVVPLVPFFVATAPIWTRWLELLGSRWLFVVAYVAFSYVSLLALYPVYYLLLKLRPLNLVTTFTAVTRFWRRHKDPGTKISDLVPADRLARYKRAQKERRAGG